MIKTFIFVEDGSIDIDELKQDVGNDVRVIAYRQGAAVPIIQQPAEPVKDIFDYGRGNNIYDEQTKRKVQSVA